jgi:hypothetical protein
MLIKKFGICQYNGGETVLLQISKGDFMFELEITLAEIVAAILAALFLSNNMMLSLINSLY